MRCDQMKDLLPLHAVGLLEPEEAAILIEHLNTGCPRCAAELAAVSEAVHLLPFAGPAEEPSPMAKARLLAAIRKDLKRGKEPLAAAGWGRTLAASVAAGGVVAILSGVMMGRREAALKADLGGKIDSQREELTALREQVRRARESIQLVSSPAVKVIDLAGQAPRSDSAARVFWDRRRASWRLYADNLPPAGPGKTYQLWLVTADAKISAGTFDPAAGGEASGAVALPPDAGPVVAAAVTDEPEGGSPQPTGTILLLGKI